MPAPKNMFTSLFKPAETVPDTQFDRFERFLPRLPDEPAKQYAVRLEQAGLAFVVTSEDLRNIITYKSTLASAEDAGLPLAMLTNPIPNPVEERMQERAVKSPQDYLREARESQGGN